MGKLLFGSFGKIVFWIAIAVAFAYAFQYPQLFLLVLILLVAGPCVAIPAIIARNGKHIVTRKTEAQLKQTVTSTFELKKFGRNWSAVRPEDGKLAYKLQSTKSGAEPVVTVDWEAGGHGTQVHIWMSTYWSGGLNGGRGTPFWVFGSNQSLAKINEVAKAIEG